MKSTTTEICLSGVSLAVEYTYYAGCKGARDSFNGRPGAGIQLEPDDEPEIEIISVFSEHGRNVYDTLSADDFERIEELLIEDCGEGPDYEDARGRW
jgi:hypothetical protein